MTNPCGRRRSTRLGSVLGRLPRGLNLPSQRSWDSILTDNSRGGPFSWAKSSDTKWAILEKQFGLGQTSSKSAGICSDGKPKSFFFGPPGTGTRKYPAQAQIRSDPDRHGCQRGPNLFGSQQTLGKSWAKFVRMAQHTSPPIFGGPRKLVAFSHIIKATRPAAQHW